MPRGIYVRTKEGICNMGEAHKGKKFSDETKRKMSEAASNQSKETRKKISEAMKGNTNCLGCKHTEETKNKMRIKRKGGISHLKKHTEEAKEKISKRLTGIMPKNKQGAGKWNNIQRGFFDINGKKIFMRSKWEANYALYLNFLIKQSQIKKWTYEEDVFIFEKIKFGTRSYRPDFKVYNLDKTIEYHEVKGYMDAKSKTKIKRMAKYYPNIKLIIIDKDVYTDIKNKIGKILKFY